MSDQMGDRIEDHTLMMLRMRMAERFVEAILRSGRIDVLTLPKVGNEASRISGLAIRLACDLTDPAVWEDEGTPDEE